MKIKKKIIKSPAKRVATRKKKNVSRKKPVKIVALMKFNKNPIISPNTENIWEAWQTFNPGVILLEDKVHFLYRAIGADALSRLGYAASGDGFVVDERIPNPAYEHQLTKPVFNYYSFASGGSFGGSEDPRLVRVNEEDVIYMTYTACDKGLLVALTSIKVQDFLQKRWRWKTPKFISPPDEVHKNWVLFPEKIQGKYAILHSISPQISIDYRDNLDFRESEYIQSHYNGNSSRKNCWDSYMRGAGAPPIKTKYGWLLFYQAMDANDMSKYKVGAMLLDLNDPTKILHRSREPILEPDEVYENNGFKAGVVYVSGAVIKDGKLLLYYGAADSYIGVAYADSNQFLEELVKDTKPKLEKKFLKKK
jgi:beta-1,2-mannobiose phosphorylase / 1,2-beta-oligomannan phosphorylase